MRRIVAAALLAITAHAAGPLQPEDLAGLQEVSDPQLSPDGRSVAYVVRTIDLKADKAVNHIWIVAWDGSSSRQLTFGEPGQNRPRWSPDGRYLAFLSSRGDGGTEAGGSAQVWLLPRAMGEAQQLTRAPNGVDDFAWSPDSRQLALVQKDVDAREKAAREARKNGQTAPPLVIDRYYFKHDVEGYLTGGYSHLWLLNVATHEVRQLTSGAHDEILPSWSPDGRTLAYSTKRGEDPDRTENWDVYLIGLEPGGAERPLVRSPEADDSIDWHSPAAWSPDGASVAFLHGGDPKMIEYVTDKLATAPAMGGNFRVLAPDLDRNVRQPRWSPDGKAVFALVEDDGALRLEAFSAAGGEPAAVVGGRRTVSAFSLGPRGEVAALVSTPDRPAEIYAVEPSGGLRPLTHQHDAWLAVHPPLPTEETRFRSADGTEVHAFVVHPALAGHGGPPPPAILLPHGGPQSQYSAQFSFEAQLFASHGYTVIMPNPRGSTGRGTRYAMGLYAAWGVADVQDDLAAVDDAIARGWADPHRLGVGGWSYGGMATNYLIASTDRFRAATSGAAASNILAGFGTDEYVRDYIEELGPPWANTATWMKISFPFLHADRIRTPTLFLGGIKDFNVPLLNSEQMYQALRQLGVPTELVIYPDQFHTLTKPSYLVDRFRRYLDWYARWIR